MFKGYNLVFSLHPHFSMSILFSVLYKSPMLLLSRVCFAIKSLLSQHQSLVCVTV